MVFFSVPGVGQVKVDTLFGEDQNHYGFIQSVVGEEYERENIKKQCIDYYMKEENPRYWDQVISLIRFCGLRRRDSNNRLNQIPFMDFVQIEYDKKNLVIADAWINYFLCKWQHPHPLMERNKERRNFSVIKPYAIILSVLKNLFHESKKSAYLTREEFYWLGYSYSNGIMDFDIENTEQLTAEILSLRRGDGWKEMYDKNAYTTHLSYPKGFLKASSILTDHAELYEINTDQKIFIGLDYNFQNLNTIIDQLIGYCNDYKFIFDSQVSYNDSKLEADFSDYLHNKDHVNLWLSRVDLFDPMDIDLLDDPDDYEYSNTFQIQKQLERLTVLDREVKSRYRTEQKILRDYLFQGKTGTCGICNKQYPAEFCACAHIKKRYKCTDEEKKDLNVVMPACYFGCDTVYEKGYIYIQDGRVFENYSNKTVSDDLIKYIDSIKGNVCNYYNEKTEQYFSFQKKTVLDV